MNQNKHKKRAWRLIQRVDGVGQSRSYAERNGLISSLATKRNYHGCTYRYLEWREINGLPMNEQDRLQDLVAFLEEVSEVYQQKTVDQYRSALAIVFKKSGKIPKVKSQIPTNARARNYHLSEVLLLIKDIQPKNSLAILLCYFSGLRAHEILTLRRVDEGEKSKSRKWSEGRFFGLADYTLYIVTGKGGLVREVAVPNELVEIIENLRLAEPRIVFDRGIKYLHFYDMGYGKSLSSCFSKASSKTLNWSEGLHGLRHSYAQNRFYQLLNLEVKFEVALKIVSEELGHFRAKITLCYLR